MGYYERKLGEGLFLGVMTILLACLVAAGPWMIGNAMAGPVLGWIFEALYIGLIAWLIGVGVRRKSRRRWPS